jgi:hypothetical protein
MKEKFFFSKRRLDNHDVYDIILIILALLFITFFYSEFHFSDSIKRIGVKIEQANGHNIQEGTRVQQK